MREFVAGSATVEVTPDEGVPMSGYGAREGPATGVHDPLAARTLVLSDGAVTAALVSVDLLNVSRELVAGVERDLADRGVDVDELLVVATHTHAGPYVPCRVVDAHPGLRTDEDLSGVVADLRAGIVESVARARAAAAPATVSVGRAENDAAAANRRALGGVGGGVRLPSGVIDPELVVLVVETDAGEETVLFNYACHPVCTTSAETLFSADWPAYVYERVSDARDGADVLFLNGAAGDINPRDKSEPREGDAVYEYMESVGEEITETVLAAVADAESSGPMTDPPLTVERRHLDLPTKAVPPSTEIERAIDALEVEATDLRERGEETAAADAEHRRRYAEQLRAIADLDATHLPARTTYVELGSVGVLGMPGEVLVRHGLDFKDRAAADVLLPAGYAHDYTGYVPTLDDLERGGYEVWTSMLSPDAITRFREAAFDLVE